MSILGITGGIASGKSTFRKLLVQRIDAIAFDADACVSELLEEDATVREQILERVHPDAYASGSPIAHSFENSSMATFTRNGRWKRSCTRLFVPAGYERHKKPNLPESLS